MNFMIYQCHVADIGNPSKWRVVLPHNEDRCIVNMDVFANYFVVYEQMQCQKFFRVVELDRVGGKEAQIDFTRHSYFIDFPESVYSVTPGNVDVRILFFKYDFKNQQRDLVSSRHFQTLRMKKKERKR